MEQTPNTPVAPAPLPSAPLRKARRLNPMSHRWDRMSIALVVAAVVVGLALILPPLQIFSRISWLGCTEVSPRSPVAFGPDGLSVALADANADNATLRVKMSSTAQEKLSAAALKALPADAISLGPLYKISACGSNKASVVLNVPASLDPTSVDTVELLSWDGKKWQWVSGHADLPNAAVVAELDMLPPNVMVVQSAPQAPVIGAEIPADAPVTDRALADVSEFAVPVFVVGEDNSLQGDIAELPAPFDDSHAMFAVVRNWSPGTPLEPAIIEDILADAKLRTANVKAVTDVAVKSKYAGAVVDYRGITEDSRANLSRYVGELAASLHKNQKRLVVVVPPPIQFGNEWNTAGYDWQAIGAAADTVQFDAPADPTVYGASRRFEKMLRWGVGEINRAKLQVAFSTSSLKQTGNSIQSISYEEALKPFKAISVPMDLEVAPGAQVPIALGDAPDLQLDAASRMYRYTLTATSGATSTVWINTGAALAQKLSLPTRFGVRGVTIKGLTDPNEPGMWTALEQYQAQALAATQSAPQLQIQWTVRGADGTHLTGGTTTLTDTRFVWTAPSNPGRFTIAAALPGSATRGEMTINVAQPTPTPTPTPTPVPEATPTRAPGATDKCPDAKFVADVTVPDGTQYEKGKEFTKTWKIRNTGSCDWPAGTVLAYAAGEKMSAPDTVKVDAVKAGETADVSVKMKSPDKDGNFEAMWRLMDDKGAIFGEKMTVIIVSGQPQVAAAGQSTTGVSAPPPSANIGGFEIGGHVQGLPAGPMKQAGMKWIKVQVHHGDIPSGIINAAHSSGFKILAGTVGDKGSVMSAAYQDEFAKWTAQLAAAGMDAIEVWNEPNIDHEWPVGQINGANYAALLAKAYPAIKNANSGTLVISAALAPTGYFAGGCQANGCNDDVFLAQMAQAGAARYMDCVGAHHNAGATSPSATTGHPADDGNHHYSWYFWPTLNLYYNAGGGRKVCFTEFGYLSGEGYPSLRSTAPAFAWASDVTVGQQTAWLAEAASLAANSGKVRLMIIWNVDFTYYGSDPQAGYAIIRPGGNCPACGALGQVMGAR